MEFLVYAANALYLFGYFTTAMLPLRAMTAAAASCLAVYFLTLPEPMPTLVAGNLFFAGLSLTQIGLILRRSRREAGDQEIRQGG